MKTMILIAVLSLSACDHSEELATCKGPLFALNTGHWVASPADLARPTPIGPRQ